MRTDKYIALLVSACIAAAACLRVPVGQGEGRLLAIAIFRLACTFCFVFFLWRLNRWASIFYALVFWSSCYPVASDMSKEAFWSVTLGMMLFVTVYFVSRSGYDRYLFVALCVSAVLHCLALSVQTINMNKEWCGFLWKGIPSGLMYNPNEASTFFALCLPAGIKSLKFSWVAVLFGAVILTGLILSKTFGGVLAVLVALLYLAYTESLFLWSSATILVVTGVYLVFCDLPTVGKRLNFWIPALKLWPRRWASGCGIGNWAETYVYLVEQGKMPLGALRLHNDWLQNMMDMGVWVMIPTIGFFAQVVLNLKRLEPRYVMSIIIILILGTVTSLFRMNAINAMASVIWLSMVAAKFTTAHKGEIQCQTM